MPCYIKLNPYAKKAMLNKYATISMYNYLQCI